MLNYTLSSAFNFFDGFNRQKNSNKINKQLREN